MFDDVVDILQVITDSETYESVRSAGEALRGLVRSQVEGKYVGKAAAPLKFGPLAINYLVDKAGLDQDQSVRRFLTIDRESLEQQPGIGAMILPEDTVVLDGPGAPDHSPGPPPGDRKVSGWFDP